VLADLPGRFPDPADGPVAAFFELSLRLHSLAVQRSEAAGSTESDRESDDADSRALAIKKTEKRIRKLLSEFRPLGLPAVLERYYHAPPGTFDRLGFYRCGTTSVILRDKTTSVIFKCILPRYMEEGRIRQGTTEQAEQLTVFKDESDLEERLPVFYPNPTETNRYTQQEFIDGLTFEEYMLRYRDRLHDPKNRDWLRRVITDLSTGLCNILAALGEGDRQHLDLSPSNIILRNCHTEDFDESAVCLIDFGRNFLLVEGVGSHLGYQTAALYAAPEIRRFTPKPDRTSDVYSIGFILLDILTARHRTQPRSLWKFAWGTMRPGTRSSSPAGEGGPSDALGIEPETWRGDLAQLWEDAPHFASLIDDCVERSPDRRLLTLRRPNLAKQFRDLGALITHKVAIDAIFAGASEQERQGGVDRLTRSVASGLAIDGFLDLIRRHGETMRLAERLPDDVMRDEGAFALPLAALLVSVEWLLVASTALLFTLADWNVGPTRSWTESLLGALPHSFDVGDWRANIAGRLTALTFAFISARYYLNIFSAMGLRTIRKQFPEFKRSIFFRGAIMRATGIVCPLVCMVGILYPRYWALFGAAGSVIIVANNYLTWKFVGQARWYIERTKVGRIADSSLEPFYRYYKEWWLLFGAYGAALGALGILLLTHTGLTGGFALGILVSIVNYVKIYRNNCRDRAHEVRGNLSRSLDIAIRGRHFENLERRAPEASPELQRAAAAV
jgi:serine/threonine protein kinase